MLAIPEEENQNESIRINQLCMSSARNVSAGSSQGEERNMAEEGHAFSILTKEQQEVYAHAFDANSNYRFLILLMFIIVHASSRVLHRMQSCHGITEFVQYWVDLAAVANRGTYTVPEFCPVSKT
mmetsp:Transcript_2713/g.6792  ORF Transcript_2713/g.6792 Transcript_2713/m.6792 type:complete len:125 (+) Transcript_2713:32-406(+)